MKTLEGRQSFQRQSTEERILNQSMKLFVERGYHGTSIDNITQAAGLTKGALYWHFKNKEELLKKVLKEFEKRFLDGLIDAVREVKGEKLDKFNKMLRYIAAFAYYNRELCASFTNLSGELIGAHHPVEPEIRRIYKKYQNFLSDLIIQGKKEKIFKSEIDTDLAALIIMAFHEGILLQWSMNRDKIDGEAFVKTYKKILLNGLMA